MQKQAALNMRCLVDEGVPIIPALRGARTNSRAHDSLSIERSVSDSKYMTWSVKAHGTSSLICVEQNKATTELMYHDSSSFSQSSKGCGINRAKPFELSQRHTLAHIIRTYHSHTNNHCRLNTYDEGVCDPLSQLRVKTYCTQ